MAISGSEVAAGCARRQGEGRCIPSDICPCNSIGNIARPFPVPVAIVIPVLHKVDLAYRQLIGNGKARPARSVLIIRVRINYSKFSGLPIRCDIDPTASILYLRLGDQIGIRVSRRIILGQIFGDQKRGPAFLGRNQLIPGKFLND